MKNCKICGGELLKAKNSEHYGCRCVKIASKNLGNTCSTRMDKACKTLDKKPELLLKQF